MEKVSYSHEELSNICLDDRFRAMKRLNVKISLLRKLNLDLVIKIVYLYINSVGRPTRAKIAFVDEVRNRSMIDNMYNTISHCPEDYNIIRLRNRENNLSNLKVGYIWPLWKAFVVVVYSILGILSLPFIGIENMSQYIVKLLIKSSEKYLKRIVTQGYKTIYAMTDHNFYSTIFCAYPAITSKVIQHGIIQDITYYQPVTTDFFLAWGEHSKQLLNDSRVIITGTYKFENIYKRQSIESNCILFCISTPNKAIVEEKINNLLEICTSINVSMKVLNHPGSYFDNLELEKNFPKVEIIKEISINEIDFTVAVIENSTILIDLIYMEKPYIIYDDLLNYFKLYSGLPISNFSDRVQEMIINYREIDYKTINSEIMKYELNNNRCSIFEVE